MTQKRTATMPTRLITRTLSYYTEHLIDVLQKLYCVRCLIVFCPITIAKGLCAFPNCPNLKNDIIELAALALHLIHPSYKANTLANSALINPFHRIRQLEFFLLTL